jgi:hypothetical protein
MVSVYSGYRNDLVHWHVGPGGTGEILYSERYRNVQFWENGLSFKTIYRDLAFFLRGSYGAFGKGTGTIRYADLDFTSDEPSFDCQTNGWAADSLGYFGYAVNLTADRLYKLLFIPFVGYSVHFELLHRGHLSPPVDSNNAFDVDAFMMTAFLPQKLHLTCYGPFVGGRLGLESMGPVSFNAGYYYSWLSYRFTTHYQNRVALFNPALVDLETTANAIHAKQGGNLGQSGWFELLYRISKYWQGGLGFNINYFSTTLFGIDLQSNVDGDSSDMREKLKVRWTSVSGWLSIGRKF